MKFPSTVEQDRNVLELIGELFVQVHKYTKSLGLVPFTRVTFIVYELYLTKPL